jgi:hypothetical protein
MLAEMFFQFLLASLFGVGVDEGYATQFGQPGDEWAGVNLACEHRPIPQDEPLCAHRWLPCGTRVVVLNLSRPGRTVCKIADRGPYGVDLATTRWRGILDMTPFAAEAVRLDGKDPVRILYLLPGIESSTYDHCSALSAVGRPAMPGL